MVYTNNNTEQIKQTKRSSRWSRDASTVSPSVGLSPRHLWPLRKSESCSINTPLLSYKCFDRQSELLPLVLSLKIHAPLYRALFGDDSRSIHHDHLPISPRALLSRLLSSPPATDSWTKNRERGRHLQMSLSWLYKAQRRV